MTLTLSDRRGPLAILRRSSGRLYAVPLWRPGRNRGSKAGGSGDAPAQPSSDTPAESSEPPPALPPLVAPPPVEHAMRRVAERDTPEHRRALFELLLEATLLAAAADPSASDAQPGLATIAGENGPVLPVFTRTDALLAWRPSGYKPVAVVGRALFEMAARYQTARIEVNPASVPRGWISRGEIEALAQGRLPLGLTQELARSGEVKIGPPAVRPPDALIESARRALDAQPDTVAGWLFAMVQDEGAPQLVVGVQLARGLDQAAQEATMQAIVEETWARSTDADRLRFMVVARESLHKSLVGGAGELIFKR
jgi:SseB protein N-terminal domain/SseB protein C-terminal domain